MADLLTDLGRVAGVLAIIGHLPYLISIWKRKTIPNPATWCIWSVMGGILLASYYVSGSREAIWVPFSYFIGAAITAGFSVKFGRNEFGGFERYCLAGAAVSLLLWWMSGPVVALTMLMMIDLIAIAPTLRKTFYKPSSEDPLSWSIFWVANCINLYVVLASEGMTYASFAYPFELFLQPTFIMILVLRGRFLSSSNVRGTVRKRQFAEGYSTQQVATAAHQFSQAPSSVGAFNTPAIGENFTDDLNDFVRHSARRMIAQAVAKELHELLNHPAKFSGDTYRYASQPLVNNESVSAESEEKTQPNDNVQSTTRQPTPTNRRLNHSMLPAYLSDSRNTEEILPWLSLNGFASTDFNDALSDLFGPQTTALSSGTIAQLQEKCQREYQNWQSRLIQRKRYVYLWADDISLNQPERDSQSILLIFGLSSDGYKELLGMEIGFRGSELSWKSLLVKLQQQGLQTDPVLAIGDSDLGWWSVLPQTFPTTRRQYCWERKTANMLKYLPKKLHSSAERNLWEIYRAETSQDAEQMFKACIETYSAKYPEATDFLMEAKASLLEFYDFPAEHWQHLRSLNWLKPTLSSFDQMTVPLTGKNSKTVLPFVFHLLKTAQKQSPRIKGFRYLGEVLEGMTFKDGLKHPEKPDIAATSQSAA